jgi:sugar phosphate isomerase/epimerase
MGPLGNAGAPRWYDRDLNRFVDYLDLLEECGATAAEVVLHDGDADDFTSRVHVVREDWETVIRGYRDRDFWVSVHAPLTPEFTPMRWRDEPGPTGRRYQPVLDQVAELAQEQNGTTLILHSVMDASCSLEQNELDTARYLMFIAEELDRRSVPVQVALEIRAYFPSYPTSAATTRASTMRVLSQTEHPSIGLCWDVAHDQETFIALGEEWSDPDDAMMKRVQHVHLHDIGVDDNEPHYPPLTGRVPHEKAFEFAPEVATIMEVRWRMAERLGEPWDVLRRSYAAIHASRRA